MAGHTCPPWVGYLLLNPLRRFLENPYKILSPFVHKGMTVLEPGCGMGYFTLPLAEMVGPEGRVVAVDLQDKMLSSLRRRAKKQGLMERIELRRATADSLNVGYLSGQVDFAIAFHVVHEVHDKNGFFSEIFTVLRPGGTLFMVEPRFHVSLDAFTHGLNLASAAGFHTDSTQTTWGSREILLRKGPAPS